MFFLTVKDYTLFYRLNYGMINFLEETIRLSHPDDQPLMYNEKNNDNGVHLSIIATYQALLSITADLCCIMRKNGSAKGVNATFLKISGYAEQEALHQPWADFIHSQDVRQHQQLLYIKRNSNEKPTSVSLGTERKFWNGTVCVSGQTHNLAKGLLFVLLCANPLLHDQDLKLFFIYV